MSIKYNKKPAPDGPGALRQWLAGGVRVGGGVLAAPGGKIGFAAGAGSELLAQAIEEGSLNQFDKGSLARAGAEGIIGLVPFAKTLRLGKAGASAVLGGAFNTAGDLGRQVAEGNFSEGGPGWNYGRTALAAGLGFGAGGIAGKFFHEPTPKAPPPTPTTPPPRTMSTPRRTVDPKVRAREDKLAAQFDEANRAYDARRIADAQKAEAGAMERLATQEAEEGRFADDFSKLFSQGIDTAGKATRSNILKSLDDAINAESKYGDRIRKGSARTEADAKAFEATSNKLDLEFQDAVRAKHDAMDLEDEATLLKEYQAKWAQEAIDEARKGKVKRDPALTERVTRKEGAKTTTATTRYETPDEDDLRVGVPVDPVQRAAQAPRGSVEGVKQVLTPKSKIRLPQNIRALLPRLDEQARADFDNYIVTGMAPQAAYRESYKQMSMRIAKEKAAQKASQPVDQVQKLVTPAAKVPRETPQLKQTTHPSFYDTGFDDLDVAPPKGGPTAPAGIPPTVPGPPPGSPAAAKLAQAERTWPADDLNELKRLSAIYNDPNTSKEGKRITGELLRELAKKHAPKADGSTPGWVSEQTAAVDSAAKAGKKGRNVTLGAGLGGGQDILRIAQENPEFAATTVGTILGGAVDAMQGDDSVMDGVLIGAGLGGGTALAPRLVRALGRSEAELADPNRVKEMAREIFNKLPQIQRASLLTSTNLPANAWLGPWGSVVTSAIEDILKGDPRGLPLLKEAWNPASFAKQMWQARDEAKELIRHGEMGRDAVDGRLGSQGGQLSAIDEATILPGQMMTSGDVVARRILEKMDYSADEARVRTLTSEPVNGFMRQLANLGKKSWLGNMMLPFKRTPANIAEQGAQRTPFLGSIASKNRNLSGREAAVEQGLGGVIGLGAYGAASNIEDDTARRRTRAWVTNPAGRYSMPANIGWLLGDAKASRRDLDKVLKDPFTYEMGTGMPLPTYEPLQEMGEVVANVYTKDLDQVTDVVPDSMEFRELRRMMAGTAEAAVGPNAFSEGIYQQPRRGIRYTRRPRRQSQ